jgi:hypothetical protein
VFANAQVGSQKTQDFVLVSKERRIHYPSGVVGFPTEFGGRLLEYESQLYQNNYNRHKTQLKNALTLLQPVSKEMGEVFEQFKGITGSLVEDTMKEAPKRFDRYIRKTLDEEQHEQDCKMWKNELEAFKKENPSHPTFDELYGKVIKKRKRKDISASDSKSDKNEFELEVALIHDQMDLVLETIQ